MALCNFLCNTEHLTLSTYKRKRFCKRFARERTIMKTARPYVTPGYYHQESCSTTRRRTSALVFEAGLFDIRSVSRKRQHAQNGCIVDVSLENGTYRGGLLSEVSKIRVRIGDETPANRSLTKSVTVACVKNQLGVGGTVIRPYMGKPRALPRTGI